MSTTKTVTPPVASRDQIMREVNKWRKVHQLPPVRPTQFRNTPTFTHKGDRQAQGRVS